MPSRVSQRQNKTALAAQLQYPLKSIMPTTAKDKKTMKPYSNSRLVSVNQCPTYGITGRTYGTTARQMALEAGSAMHEVFAAVRLWQLGVIQRQRSAMEGAAHRIFGPEKWKVMCENVEFVDTRDDAMSLAFGALHNSGYEDDGRDRNRTIANMEIASIRYIDARLAQMEEWPIYISPDKKIIGVEQVFDVTLVYTDGKKIRYIGTIDGLTQSLRSKKYHLDENKTASRLDDAWRRSFDMSHQITGYCAASTSVYGFPVLDAHVYGVRIAQSKYDNDLEDFTVPRTTYSILQWGQWVRTTVGMVEEYTLPDGSADIENTPRYTHSCNRYFRPCSMIPFCADTPEGRAEQYEQMIPVKPSPSELAIMEGT